MLPSNPPTPNPAPRLTSTLLGVVGGLCAMNAFTPHLTLNLIAAVLGGLVVHLTPTIMRQISQQDRF